MISIHAEMQAIADGKQDRQSNLLKNAPHTARQIASDKWDRSYSRQQAAFPAPWTRDHKFWPAVGRIDNVYGDRNLFCSCPPVESSDGPTGTQMTGDDAKQILTQLLASAEQRYGPRAHEVEFDVREEANAAIRVEPRNEALTKATVYIQSGIDLNQRRFQLALEGFHLLSMVPRHEVTFFEEGLSQIFALSETVGLLPSEDQHYKKAHQLCQKLLDKCGADIVCRLRQKRRYISRITPVHILELCPRFSNSDAEALCQRWPYYQ
jgi:hypothetical protein